MTATRHYGPMSDPRPARRYLPAWTARIGWRMALTSLVAGGIIHIVATLVIPKFAAENAYQRLAADLPFNRMRVLPPTTAERQPLSFVGPDVRLAVCRYSVAEGPVTITATLPDRGWSLSAYSTRGDSFYAVPAQDMRILDVTLTLAPKPEKFLGLFSLGRTFENNLTQIQAPTPEGLIVIRAPLRGRVYQSDVESMLRKARCQIGTAS